MNATAAKSSVVPALLLTAMLLLLAFRLTCTESLRETMTQKAARLDSQERPSPDNYIAPFVGPAWTAGYVTIALLLAGGTAWVAARRGALSRRQFGQFLLIAAILGVLVASTLHAADRFSALVGLADVATGLLCAWTAALLCDDALLGRHGRNGIIAAIVAILSIGVAKGLMQHFIELPDLADYVQQHTDEALRRAGISDDPAQRTLFLSRVNSAEVSGFGGLSNVFATQMIALLALAAAIIVAMIPRLKRGTSAEDPRKAPRRHKSPAKILNDSTRQARQKGEIPIEHVAFVGLCIVLVASIFVLPMTQSKGGTAAGVLVLVAIALGAWLRGWIVAHRRSLLIAGAACLVLAAAAVVGYGITRHRLPTKSLLFRWQYWTATVPMVEQSPALGVGLNNFGDYYPQYKSPASPEDVKDPHNFFVRLVAEAGIPATLLLTGLMLWLIMRGFRGAQGKADTQIAEPENQQSTIQNQKSPLILAGVVAILWIPLHILSESNDAFTASMTMIYAVFGWAVFATARVLLDAIAAAPNRPAVTPLPPRFIALACVAAALCMLLYDQVNMALVTGPVAMLFWLLLALGAAADEPAGRVTDRARGAGWLIGIVCLGGGVVSAALFFFPLATDSFALDPAPFEFTYLRDLEPETRNIDQAMSALNRAIALSPNSGELAMQRIRLKRDLLHQPVAEDIRHVLQLDRANAHVRLDLALPDTDLPPAERIAALQDALRFDEALAAFGQSFNQREPKQLSDEQIEAARQTIARLSAATTQ